LSIGSQSGIARKGNIVTPLLIECDLTGKVLWMSQGARDLLGDPAHLTDLVGITVPVGRGRRARVYASQFCRVWESRDSVLLNVRLPEIPDAGAVDFQPLESRLFQKFFRLVVQERRLFDNARKRGKPGSGRTAIRQIELERQRLARELHTGVGQTLAAIRLQIEVISTELPDPPPRVGQALDSISALAGGALEQVRSVSQRLHPPEWQRLTLGSALRQLWEISGIPDRFEGELRLDPLPLEPVLEVKALYHRDNPIILGVPPEKPPYEAHRFRQYLRSANLRRELRLAGVPDVVGAWCHTVGGCRLFNVVAITQRYPGHARQAGHVASQCRAGAYLGRITVVVDEDIDITDLNEVMWAVCTRADPERSLDFIHRAWSGPLDPAIEPGKKGFNSRLIIDATRPWEWREKFPPAIGPTPEQKRITRERWGWILKS